MEDPMRGSGLATGESHVIVGSFKVHYQATAPVPSWTAWKRWQTGALIVHDDHAEFVSRGGERIGIRDVTEVDQPSRRELRKQHDISWLVNTWVAVHYTTPDGPAVAYFNDARLRGYGHYLPHTEMRRCLGALASGETNLAVARPEVAASITRGRRLVLTVGLASLVFFGALLVIVHA
jgi:hypothetical protein